jgi:hypothetical protein
MVILLFILPRTMMLFPSELDVNVLRRVWAAPIERVECKLAAPATCASKKRYRRQS